jgi:hypothetical protein
MASDLERVARAAWDLGRRVGDSFRFYDRILRDAGVRERSSREIEVAIDLEARAFQRFEFLRRGRPSVEARDSRAIWCDELRRQIVLLRILKSAIQRAKVCR